MTELKVDQAQSQLKDEKAQMEANARKGQICFQACSAKTGEGIWEGIGQLCDAVEAIDNTKQIETKSEEKSTVSK